MDDSKFQLGLLQARNHDSTSLERKMGRLRSGAGEQTLEEKQAALKEACQGFETIFLTKLWQQMRSTIPKEGYLHSRQEEFYLSMFDTEMAKSMASGQGMGIAKIMYDQLRTRLEEASDTTRPGEVKPLKSLVDPDPATPQQEEAAPLYAQHQSPPGFQHIQNDDHDQVKQHEELKPASPEPALATAQNVPAGAGSPGANAAKEPRAAVMERVEQLAREIEARKKGPDRSVEITPAAAVQDMDHVLPPMTWPLEGRVSSGFGWRPDPFDKHRAWHAGIDLVAPEGSPIKACWPGKVVFSGDWGGYGKSVVLEHPNGWRSIYAHNSANLVQEGDRIEAGQRIAELGNTGRSTGPHLHFELRQGDQAWDPRHIRRRMMAGLKIGNQA